AGWGVDSALSQGGQQEAAAEGKEGQGFRGSYLSPQGAGGRKKKATKIRRWRVSQTCAQQWPQTRFELMGSGYSWLGPNWRLTSTVAALSSARPGSWISNSVADLLEW